MFKRNLIIITVVLICLLPLLGCGQKQQTPKLDATIEVENYENIYNRDIEATVSARVEEELSKINPTTTPMEVPPTPTPKLDIASDTPTPTIKFIEATPEPLGGLTIGALKSDGSVAAESHETNRILLYPKTLEDAAGVVHGDISKRISATPHRQTGLATFSNLEPGSYIVCFSAPSGSVKVGEVTVEANVILKKNLSWPPSWNIGSNCENDI